MVELKKNRSSCCNELVEPAVSRFAFMIANFN